MACKFFVTFQTFLALFFALFEELFRNVGLRLLQRAVTRLAEDELLIACGRILAVQSEGILAFLFEGRIVPVKLPITAVDRALFLFLALAHVDAVVDAGRVGDDQRRSVIFFRLDERVEELLFVAAHRHLCDVHITVAHRHHAEVLLFDPLAGGGELRNRTGRGRLGSLAARVGINFGIEYEHIDVFAGGENVIQSAVTDIVSPAVAAEDPDGFLDEAVFRLIDLFAERIAVAAAVFAAFQRLDKFIGRRFAAFRVFHIGEPFFAGSLAFGIILPAVFGKLFDFRREFGAPCAVCEVHAVAEFRIVFEQAVRPSGAVAVFVDRVGACRGGTAVDRGAARRVRDDHAVAEHLGDDFDVRRLSASRASARELEEGLIELAALDRRPLDGRGVGLLDFLRIIPVFGIGIDYVFQRHHDERFVALHAGADIRAHAAAHAIQRRYLHTELRALQSGGGLGDKGIGLCRRIVDHDGADTCVRADEGALVALDAVFSDPLRHFYGDAALFKLGRADGNGAVRIERGGGQLIAFEHKDGMYDVFEVLIVRHGSHRSAFGRICPAFGVFDFDESALCGVDRRVVHVDDRVALTGELFVNGLLHVIRRLIVWHDRVVDIEECRLHDRARLAVQADVGCDLDRVDIIEFEVFFRDLLFDLRGQVLFELIEGVPGGVQKEFAAFLRVGKHVVAGDIRRVMAGDEVRTVDQIGRLNGRLAETEVRNGDAARFFGIVEEVCLRIHIGMVADDLDGILVCADRTV